MADALGSEPGGNTKSRGDSNPLILIVWPRGGIGRRAGFKSRRRLNLRAGSTPVRATLE